MTLFTSSIQQKDEISKDLILYYKNSLLTQKNSVIWTNIQTEEIIYYD